MQWFARSRSVLALHVHFRISRTRRAQKACLLRLCALAESHHQRATQELARFIGKLKKSEFEELL